MAYADYDFYLNTYFGNTVSEEDFPSCLSGPLITSGRRPRAFPIRWTAGRWMP